MKHFIIFIASFFLFIIQVDAKEKADQTQSIKKLIKQIKNSSSDDRRVAMNKLKIELRTMNKETRKKVMLDLQNSFAKNSTGRQISHKRSGITNSSQRSMKGQQQGVPMQQQHRTPTPVRNAPAPTPMRPISPPRHGQPGGHR
ncbi:hypothetical protein ACLHDG_06985 [Sulfurovum sp. CS9]|uniref:hypothetical protein n=1 Tax=Sulfurovum sp. CS9 TaxID=3391146 RepID=UPI0039EB0366